ncbi:MAG: HU family DNA-binding protein, partial [Chloroflexi bacterium]|nr:HU family DNA-binding protein [Chloroflexota bacterium]
MFQWLGPPAVNVSRRSNRQDSCRIRQRAPRIAQNPKTLERVPVPAKKTVKFKVGRLMRIALEDGAVSNSENDRGNGAKVRKQRKRAPEPVG